MENKILMGDAINALMELSKKLGELTKKLTVSNNSNNIGLIAEECSTIRSEYESLRRLTEGFEEDHQFDSWDQRVLNTLEKIESEISLPSRDRRISRIGGSQNIVFEFSNLN